jgi:hypothetical protein
MHFLIPIFWVTKASILQVILPRVEEFLFSNETTDASNIDIRLFASYSSK